MSETLSPRIRLWGISPAQFPSETSSPEELKQFLTALLRDGLAFVKDVPADPETLGSENWKPKGLKSFEHSVAPVYLFQRDVSVDDLRQLAASNDSIHVSKNKIVPETWFLRRSLHKDAATKGTATWDEFVRCFKNEHAESELAFTPSILNTKLHRQWDCSSVEIEHDGQTWVDWTLKYEGSTHKLPAPLKKRYFPVLQATASVRDKREFVTIQICVDGPAESDKTGEATPSDATKAVYTSIERVVGQEKGIEWVMGTVSDARGGLPSWLQKLSVPNAVAKDVGMFMEWISSQRK